jgi:DNA-binding response OmpR family regulator
MKQNSRILIVDDEPLARQLLEAILLPEKFELFFAETGREAFDRAIEIIPDIILMDVMMPDMDGFEVCKKLRAHDILGNVPIILITALDDRDSRIQGLNAGADDYIAKPYDRIEVLAKVKNIAQLNRYKSTLGDSEKSESENKRYSIQDKSIHYTSLIQKSLLPSKLYLRRLFPEHFVIIRHFVMLSSNIFRVSEKDNNIIILLSHKRHKEISDVLINILGNTLINNIVSKKEELNAGEVLDDLRKSMYRHMLSLGDRYASFQSMSFALCILNKENHKMQYSGSNVPLFIISEKSAKKIDPGSKTDNKKYQNYFKNIEINLRKNDSFYIFSDNLLRYFEEDYKNIASKDLIAVLNELQNSDMKQQEVFFNELIEKAASENKKLEDIFIIGVRV